ncbi:MAG: hypothetical protein PHU08_04480, partial [Dehalococcoidales bacterium]|nr:hypothetical protein [Dehalococcoidales bacterium]
HQSGAKKLVSIRVSRLIALYEYNPCSKRGGNLSEGLGQACIIHHTLDYQGVFVCGDLFDAGLEMAGDIIRCNLGRHGLKAVRGAKNVAHKGGILVRIAGKDGAHKANFFTRVNEAPTDSSADSSLSGSPVH